MRKKGFAFKWIGIKYEYLKYRPPKERTILKVMMDNAGECYRNARTQFRCSFFWVVVAIEAAAAADTQEHEHVVSVFS